MELKTDGNNFGGYDVPDHTITVSGPKSVTKKVISGSTDKNTGQGQMEAGRTIRQGARSPRWANDQRTPKEILEPADRRRRGATE